MIFEIADRDLAALDLTDGSLDDWSDIVGEPTLTTTDLVPISNLQDSYDPLDLDYRIWLGWNATRSHLLFAMERFDDSYG